MHIRKLVFQILKILLGITLLFLSIRSVDWSVFQEALQSAKQNWLIFALVSVLLSVGLKITRWWILLRNFQVKIPWTSVVTAYFLGQAANILFIFRTGELVRIGWAHQSDQKDLVEISGSIAIEKYVDLLMFVVATLAVSATLPEHLVKNAVFYQKVAITVSLILAFIILLGPWAWGKFFANRQWQGFLEKIAVRMNGFISASLWLRKPQKIFPVIFLSVLIWVIMGLTNKLLFTSLGLSLNWQAAGLVMILVYFGVLPALMPGNLGPFTYFAQLALLPFKVESSTGLAFAVILYGLVNIPILVIAGFLLMIPKIKSKRTGASN